MLVSITDMKPAGAVVGIGVSPSGSTTVVMGPAVMTETTSCPGALVPTSFTVEGKMYTAVMSSAE